MKYQIRILSETKCFWAEGNLLEALRKEKVILEAPCGGQGRCGKCKVIIDGEEILACQTEITKDMEITLPKCAPSQILTYGIRTENDFCPEFEGYLTAVDIGTTTLVGYLLDKNGGRELACASMVNPQTEYGADVVTRIRSALSGKKQELVQKIWTGVSELIEQLCQNAKIDRNEIGAVAVVGNPAMQQLFLNCSLKNLVKIPFPPLITETKIMEAKEVLPICQKANLMMAPEISGYIGADTVAAVLASGMHQSEKLTLLVDIGTNGEMVLGSSKGMIACSTAAGPALEGAGIRFGMRGADGAIDHVWMENGELRYHVIGDGEARGICGSGIVDAVAVAWTEGVINERGRIMEDAEKDGMRIWKLCNELYLTQEDIRAVQLAKGAIAAGIELMAEAYGVQLEEIEQVQLAGAFGNYIDHHNACRIGLLPAVLEQKIQPIGNAAGSGAKLLVSNRAYRKTADQVVKKTAVLELAAQPSFQKTFARCMRFGNQQ